MSRHPRITKSDIMLLAATKLPAQFTAEDLSVAAWGISKEMFGLAGFEQQYPDVNKVLCALMGKKGLVARGRFRQVGRGTARRYTLP